MKTKENGWNELERGNRGMDAIDCKNCLAALQNVADQRYDCRMKLYGWAGKVNVKGMACKGCLGTLNNVVQQRDECHKLLYGWAK